MRKLSEENDCYLYQNAITKPKNIRAKLIKTINSLINVNLFGQRKTAYNIYRNVEE